MNKSGLFLSILLSAWLALAPAAAQEKPGKRPAASRAPTAQPLPAGVLGNIELSQVRLEEVARLLSKVGGANVVVTSKVSDITVSLYLHNASVEDMVRNVCRAAGVWFRLDSGSKTYVIMSGEEYQKDLAIVRDEQVRVFTLRHHNVVSTANAIRALFGTRVLLGMPVEEMPPVSLGSGNRTNTGGSGNNRGGGTTGNTAGGVGNTGLTGGNAMGNQGQSGQFGNQGMAGTAGMMGAMAGGAAVNYDPRSDLSRMSQDRLAQQMQQDGERHAVAASDIQDMAARQGPAILVTYNKLNNLLMVRTGDEQALKDIGQLIAEMDRPPKQVLLEMKILEVTLDDGYRSVFDIGLGSRGTSTGPTTYTASDGVLTRPTSGSYNRNGLGSGLFGAEQDANLLWQLMSSTLSLRLQLLANENKLKVLSSPMLVAANNQLARLFIGDERVLTVGASSQSTTGTTGATNTTITVETEKRDVGQTLAILPRINGDRSISLTVDQDSSTVKVGDATLPISTASGTVIYFPIDTVNTANLQVTAHAKDGMTVAIGGMIRETVIRDDEKVPLLGDVPGLGFFFKRDVRSKVRTQIVLLVTPRIIETPEEGKQLADGKLQDFAAVTAGFPNNPTVPKLSGGDAPAVPASNPPPRSDSDEAAYAALARAAAAATQQRTPGKSAPAGLLPAPAASKDSFALSNGMRADVAGTWTRDGLYVTALRVSNPAPLPAALQAEALPGRWAAVLIDNPALGPDGAVDDATWLYAISRHPFAEALELP